MCKSDRRSASQQQAEKMDPSFCAAVGQDTGQKFKMILTSRKLAEIQDTPLGLTGMSIRRNSSLTIQIVGYFRGA